MEKKKTKSMVFEAPLPLHEAIEDLLPDTIYNKKTFVLVAVQEKVEKLNKKKKK